MPHGTPGTPGPGTSGTPGLFTGKAADYVQARPGYPAALFDELQALCALRPASDVVDIGAGTGLFTAPLLERGHRVVAVEPNDDMRAACDAWLGDRLGYSSCPGRAESTGQPDASADLIVAAQAFHWFEVDGARREALRVLRPHGQVALVWNDRLAEDPLQRALDEVLDEHGGEGRSSMLAQDDRGKVPVFFGGGFLTRHFPNSHRLPLEGLMSLVFSRSYMPRRATEAGRRAEAALHSIFDRFQRGGSVEVRYDTVLMLGRPVGASVRA